MTDPVLSSDGKAMLRHFQLQPMDVKTIVYLAERNGRVLVPGGKLAPGWNVVLARLEQQNVIRWDRRDATRPYIVLTDAGRALYEQIQLMATAGSSA